MGRSLFILLYIFFLSIILILHTFIVLKSSKKLCWWSSGEEFSHYKIAVAVEVCGVCVFFFRVANVKKCDAVAKMDFFPSAFEYFLPAVSQKASKCTRTPTPHKHTPYTRRPSPSSLTHLGCVCLTRHKYVQHSCFTRSSKRHESPLGHPRYVNNPEQKTKKLEHLLMPESDLKGWQEPVTKLDCFVFVFFPQPFPF